MYAVFCLVGDIQSFHLLSVNSHQALINIKFTFPIELIVCMTWRARSPARVIHEWKRNEYGSEYINSSTLPRYAMHKIPPLKCWIQSRPHTHTRSSEVNKMHKLPKPLLWPVDEGGFYNRLIFIQHTNSAEVWNFWQQTPQCLSMHTEQFEIESPATTI